MTAVRVLATAALALASGTLLSYSVGWEPLRRWLEPPMAINTALCFLLLSAAILLLTRKDHR